MMFPDALLFLNAPRTDSVLATTNASSPAAAMRPFPDATVSREAVGGGRASTGQGVGRSRSFRSAASARNPSDYTLESAEVQREISLEAYIGLDLLKIRTNLHLSIPHDRCHDFGGQHTVPGDGDARSRVTRAPKSGCSDLVSRGQPAITHSYEVNINQG